MISNLKHFIIISDTQSSRQPVVGLVGTSNGEVCDADVTMNSDENERSLGGGGSNSRMVQVVTPRVRISNITSFSTIPPSNTSHFRSGKGEQFQTASAVKSYSNTNNILPKQEGIEVGNKMNQHLEKKVSRTVLMSSISTTCDQLLLPQPLSSTSPGRFAPKSSNTSSRTKNQEVRTGTECLPSSFSFSTTFPPPFIPITTISSSPLEGEEERIKRETEEELMVRILMLGSAPEAPTGSEDFIDGQQQQFDICPVHVSMKNLSFTPSLSLSPKVY